MITLVGRVESGFGLATNSLAPIHDALCEKSSLALVPGTLNVRLPAPFIVVPDFVMEARDYGHHETLLLQRCRVSSIEGLIVRTSTQAAGKSHPLDVVELLAVRHLRESLHLDDGDALTIEVARTV